MNATGTTNQTATTADTLTDAERDKLAQYEAEVELSNSGFLRVGRALIAIQAERLYRVVAPTFEGYALKRFRMASASAYRFMRATEVHDELCALAAEAGSLQLERLRESVLRPLTRVPAEERRPVLDALLQRVASSKATRVTAPLVEDVVREVAPDHATGAKKVDPSRRSLSAQLERIAREAVELVKTANEQDRRLVARRIQTLLTRSSRSGAKASASLEAAA